jgi:hypothetical protein
MDQHRNSEATFRISGTIVNSLTGAPLNQARVSITDTGDPANTAFIVTSGDGHFAFTSLQRGKFSLEGAKRGYLPGGYEQHQQFTTAIVTGTAFNTANLVLRLTPFARLSGEVLDETGEPVRGAGVQVWMLRQLPDGERVRPVSWDVTDDQGYYEFVGLGPGDYFLAVAAKPWYAVHPPALAPTGQNSPSGVSPSLDVTYPTIYNDGAIDTHGLAPISVHGGEQLQRDIHLSPVPVLHLIYRLPKDASPQNFRPPVFQRHVFNSEQYVQSEGVRQIDEGVFEVLGVPAGKYQVITQDSDSGHVQRSAEVNLLRDGQELDTAAGEAFATVKFSVNPPSHESLPQQLDIALRDSQLHNVAYQTVDSSGQVQFENVPPGNYTVLAYSPTRRYSVARTQVSGIEIPGHALSVAPGSSPDVSVFLASGVVDVEGFAMRANKPCSGVLVALVPDDPQAHLEFFRRDQSNSDGSFILSGVIPGTYTLIAVEDAWNIPWQTPSALKRYVAHGQKLTVGELMTNTVHLPDALEVQSR